MLDHDFRHRRQGVLAEYGARMVKRSSVLVLLVVARGAAADPPGVAPTLDVSPHPTDHALLARTTLYAEVGGPGILYSLNVERLVRDDVGVRVGFSTAAAGTFCGEAGCGFTSNTSANANIYLVPITASYLGIHAHRHVLELGGGATVAHAQRTFVGGLRSATGGFASALVGYRFHPVDSDHFQFRIGSALLAGNGFGITVSSEHRWH
jgi:hypothetical protein